MRRVAVRLLPLDPLSSASAALLVPSYSLKPPSYPPGPSMAAPPDLLPPVAPIVEGSHLKPSPTETDTLLSLTQEPDVSERVVRGRHRRQLYAWWSYAVAAECFAAVAQTVFLPLALEQTARERGFLEPDHTISCMTPGGDDGGAGSDPHRCKALIAGIWIDTASFSLVPSSQRLGSDVLAVVATAPTVLGCVWSTSRALVGSALTVATSLLVTRLRPTQTLHLLNLGPPPGAARYLPRQDCRPSSPPEDRSPLLRCSRLVVSHCLLDLPSPINPLHPRCHRRREPWSLLRLLQRISSRFGPTGSSGARCPWRMESRGGEAWRGSRRNRWRG